MSLSVEQKSVYLIILNATMILRAVGKTFKKNKKKLKDFKIETFIEIEKLINKMEHKQLNEADIVSSIERISDKCGISFGQAQKVINVLLKYHYHLNKRFIDKTIKEVLYCPLDSVVLYELGVNQSLTKINKENFLDIQQNIARRIFPRIDFDKQWDKQHLEDEGIY